MKKKLVSILLVLGMLPAFSACRLKSRETTTRKTRETTKATTTEETTEETTDEPTERTTASATSSSETSESTTQNQTIPAVTPCATVNADFKAPDPNCPIEYRSEDERYHYTMELQLDPDKRTVGGHVVCEFYNNSEDDWDKLCLRDYSSLFIDSKTAGYDTALDTNGALTEITNIKDGRDDSDLSFERDSDVSVVWMPLSKKLAPKEKMTLSYDFVATIPTVADRYGITEKVYNITNFYPILAVYTKDGWSHERFYDCGECFFSEVSDYDVTLTVPKDYTVLSTGTSKSEEEKDGNKVITFDAPCVRDFVFCASPDFKMFEGYYKNTKIRVVYDQAHPSTQYMDEVSEACIEAGIDSLAAFGAAFGEYPYPELDIVLATIAAGGMEYPNLIICTDLNYYCMPIADRDRVSDKYVMMSTVVAHEIGHQWFMGIVGSNSGMEPWLDESFASYTELVYGQYIGYDSGYSRRYMNLVDMADDMKREGSAPINRPYYDFSSDDPYINAAYFYGQVCLYQMQEIIGQEAMYGVIREYVRRNAFHNATAKDFFDVLYECCGKDNKDLNDLIAVVFDMDRVYN